MPNWITAPHTVPTHGGNLQQAIQRYGGDSNEWLDLSSAINADPWPVPAIPASLWHPLPQASSSWPQVCRHYYGPHYPHEGLLCAGSQVAIMALPHLLSVSTVWMLAGSYGEHAHHWQQAGHTVVEWGIDALYHALQQPLAEWPDVLLLVNPDNPSGHCYPLAQLRQWQQGLQQRGGWLILDKAFMDCQPQHSWLMQPQERKGYNHDNVIVLRSLGKFFGLAGARLGVVFAHPPYRELLARQLGPWPLTGPSQWLAERALEDVSWQQQQRTRLQQQRAISERVFAGCAVQSIQPLFVTLSHAQVADWHDALAQRRIWTRLFAQQQRLRFGLPIEAHDWQRLHTALVEIQAP